jgi:hypothetical protein
VGGGRRSAPALAVALRPVADARPFQRAEAEGSADRAAIHSEQTEAPIGSPGQTGSAGLTGATGACPLASSKGGQRKACAFALRAVAIAARSR